MGIGRAMGVLGTVVVTLFVAGAAVAEVPAGVTLRNLNYAGGLCPAGTVTPESRGIGDKLELYFDSFVVQAAPWLSRNEARKICSLMFDLQVPPGWTYAIESFKTEATFATLPRGSAAEIRVMAPIRSGGEIARHIANVRGPLDSDLVLQSPATSQLVFMPCGRPATLSMNIDARVGPQGILTGDSVDRSVSLNFKLVWKRCE